MHLELLEVHRRIQGRVPLPWLELNAEILATHQAAARPVLRFENIPLDLTDLRLMVRQIADILRRHGALEEADYERVQTLGRDMKLIAVAGVAISGAYNWQRIKPRLGTDAATNQLQRSASAEIVLALLVLVATAILVALPTP